MRTQRTRENHLGLHHDSEKILQMSPYWIPSVPAWKPLLRKPNSSLRFAGIVEDRLYHGLRFEGELMLLTPQNYKMVLKYGKPDMLIMESVRKTATGHFRMAQCNAPGLKNELLEIIELSRALSIPTVFWMTKGHEYTDHYRDFAGHFDYVFCADPIAAEQFHKKGIDCEVLLPCVQPAIFNPFRMYSHYNALKLNVLFDGWADLDRMPDKFDVLKELEPYGLSIIESQYKIFRNRMEVLPEYKAAILGNVSAQSRLLALKYATAYVTFEHSLSHQTTQQWMSLEAAACQLAVTHLGHFTEGDVRKGIVSAYPNELDFLTEFFRYHKDALYRRRIAHKGWRKVLRHHTFAKRIQAICRRIGMHHDWVEFPKVSMVTPTYRSDMIQRCLENLATAIKRDN